MKISERQRLELLLGATKTRAELIDVWNSNHTGPRVTGEDFAPNDTHIFTGHDTQIWRAKLRYMEGSLTGLLDAIALCARDGRSSPEWLTASTLSSLAPLLPRNEAFGPSLRTWKNEIKHLKRQRQVLVMQWIYRRHRLQNNNQLFTFENRQDSTYAVPATGKVMEGWAAIRTVPSWLQIASNDAIAQKAAAANFNLNQEYLSLAKAAELASICLRGTGARAAASTIGRAYKQTVDYTLEKLNVSDLESVQSNNLSYDPCDVTSDTTKLLGLTDDIDIWHRYQNTGFLAPRKSMP